VVFGSSLLGVELVAGGSLGRFLAGWDGRVGKSDSVNDTSTERFDFGWEVLVGCAWVDVVTMA